MFRYLVVTRAYGEAYRPVGIYRQALNASRGWRLVGFKAHVRVIPFPK